MKCKVNHANLALNHESPERQPAIPESAHLKSEPTRVQPKLDRLTDRLLHENLQKLVRTERQITVRILEYIREVDRRKIYLEMAYGSLFSYLTEGLGYTPASAQRRIENARMMEEVPELKEKLESGALNISQVSLVSKALRQKRKEEPKRTVSTAEKSLLLNQLEQKDLNESQVLIAQAFHIQPEVQEKLRRQADGSTRMEIRFTLEQLATLQKAKDLLSHQHPYLGMSELFLCLAEDYVKRKDPARERRARKSS